MVLKVAVLSVVLSVAIKLTAYGSIGTPPDWVAWVMILLPSLILAGWMWQQSKPDRP
jgi:protein-S-isoprenylcysteine O-methyltransferase Ste14